MQLAAAACRAKLEEAKRTFRERAALDRELETWKASKRLRTFCEGIVEDDPEFANALFASMIPSTRKGKKDFDSWTDKEKIKLINEWKGHWDDHLKKSLSSGVHGEATVEYLSDKSCSCCSSLAAGTVALVEARARARRIALRAVTSRSWPRPGAR